MSVAAVDKVLSSLKTPDVIAFFQDMPEKERKAHSARVLEWLDVCSIHHNEDFEFRAYLPGNQLASRVIGTIVEPPKRIKKMLQQLEEARVTAKTMPPQVLKKEAIAVAQVAALATAGIGDIKKRVILPNPDDCYAVLCARKPSWLQSFVDWALEEAPHTHWMVARRLERDAIYQPEHNSHYYSGMALTLPGLEPPPQPTWQDGKLIRPAISEGTVVSVLVADPALVEEIWGMFTDDQTMRLLLHEQPPPSWRDMQDGQWSLRWRLTNAAGTRWGTALVKLTHDDLIDKQRLLEAIMGLFVSFNLEHSESGTTLRIDWFTNLHDKLEPTIDQRFSIHQDYLRLIACRNPKVVAWTLEKLGELVDHPEFPTDLVCETIPTAFLLKGKEHSIQALKTLKLIAEKHPSAKRVVAVSTIEALESESQDIQKRALTMLEKLKIKDDQLVQQMQAKLGRVAIVHRAQASSWVGCADVVETEEAPENVIQLRQPPTVSATDLSALQQRISALPETFRKCAGVDEALSAVQDETLELSAIRFRGDEIPRLNPDKKLQQLENVDDLIFFLSRVTQQPMDAPLKADEIEIGFDAFARLGAERPHDFAARTEALKAKMQPLAQYTVDPLQLTTLAWTTGEVPNNLLRALVMTWRRTTAVDDHLRERFRRLTRKIVQGRTVNALSTPTHQGGWIDPLILVDRVKSRAQRPNAPAASKTLMSKVLSIFGAGSNGDSLDESLSILRIAPDHREQALQALGNVPRDEFVEALRYALGADDVAIGKTPELWVAAARSRYPFDDDERIAAHFPDLGPNGPCAARYRLMFTLATPADWQQGTKDYHLVDVAPAMPSGNQAQRLISVLVHEESRGLWFVGNLLDWRRTITPMNLNAFFAEAIDKIVWHDGVDSAGRLNVVYLEPLYDPDVPITSMASVMLIVAMASKQKDEHSIATEALIAAIDDGRLTGAELGAQMQELHASGGLRPSSFKAPYISLVSMTRWGKALAPAAQSSPYHAYVIARAIERFCQGDPKRAPKDLHLLLEILLTCLVEGDDCLRSEATREYLSTLAEGKGASKTSKLLKSILSLKQGPNYSRKRREALEYALEKRLERAERWTSWVQNTVARSDR